MVVDITEKSVATFAFSIYVIGTMLIYLREEAREFLDILLNKKWIVLSSFQCVLSAWGDLLIKPHSREKLALRVAKTFGASDKFPRLANLVALLTFAN